MAAKVIEREGKKIYLVDFRGMQDQEELLRLLSRMDENLSLMNPQSPLLLLIHCEGALFGPAVHDRVLQFGKFFTDKNLVSKTAVLGMEGVKSILLQSYLVFTKNKATKTFITEAEAIRWLVSA